MFNDFIAPLRDAFGERLLLIANHLLWAEPAACARLRPHAGRKIGIEIVGAPKAFAQTAWRLRITPAGLLETDGTATEPPSASDLRLVVEAPAAPVQHVWALWRGEASMRPPVRIEGDAAFAADVDWCLQHVRWDAEHDLGQLLGAAPARQLTAFCRTLAAGLRSALQRRPMGPQGAATADDTAAR